MGPALHATSALLNETTIAESWMSRHQGMLQRCAASPCPGAAAKRSDRPRITVSCEATRAYGMALMRQTSIRPLWAELQSPRNFTDRWPRIARVALRRRGRGFQLVPSSARLKTGSFRVLSGSTFSSMVTTNQNLPRRRTCLQEGRRPRRNAAIFGGDPAVGRSAAHFGTISSSRIGPSIRARCRRPGRAVATWIRLPVRPHSATCLPPGSAFFPRGFLPSRGFRGSPRSKRCRLDSSAPAAPAPAGRAPDHSILSCGVEFTVFPLERAGIN